MLEYRKIKRFNTKNKPSQVQALMEYDRQQISRRYHKLSVDRERDVSLLLLPAEMLQRQPAEERRRHQDLCEKLKIAPDLLFCLDTQEILDMVRRFRSVPSEMPKGENRNYCLNDTLIDAGCRMIRQNLPRDSSIAIVSGYMFDFLTKFTPPDFSKVRIVKI